MERTCCACGKERDVTPTRFPLLRTAYLLGPLCRASWRIEAQSMRNDINNAAKVHMTFIRWLDTRRAAA